MLVGIAGMNKNEILPPPRMVILVILMEYKPLLLLDLGGGGNRTRVLKVGHKPSTGLVTLSIFRHTRGRVTPWHALLPVRFCHVYPEINTAKSWLSVKIYTLPDLKDSYRWMCSHQDWKNCSTLMAMACAIRSLTSVPSLCTMNSTALGGCFWFRLGDFRRQTGRQSARLLKPCNNLNAKKNDEVSFEFASDMALAA